jgi:predicted  nucleic acid-binding Zn-ribbon protein
LLILEALEQVGIIVQQSSTKADINNIVDRVDKILREQTEVQYGLETLKHKFQEEVNLIVSNLKQETDHLKDEIKNLDNILKSVNNYVSGLQSSHSQLGAEFRSTTDNLHRSINETKSGGIGFWTLFFVIIVLFSVAVFYIGRYRELTKRNDKLF